MCEIFRSNFEEKFEDIENMFKSATFIALDSEFSGLLSSPEHKTSLFDDGSERYIHLKNNIEQFMIMQVGITAFVFDRENYKFRAYTLIVPVFPRSCSSIDRKFLCQASSLEFLCHYNFDFNKFVYDGVPFLSFEHESKIRQELKQGTLFRHLERTLSMDDERSIQAECSRVAEWVHSAVDGSVFQLSDSVRYQSGKLAEYLLLEELRRRFFNIWTYLENGRIIVKKVSAADRKKFEEDTEGEENLQENLVNHFLGFSRVFKLLTDIKKPIVGHNLLLDLMLMYNQFHESLPNNYTVFKNNIHRLFPTIFDTKYISFEFKRLLGRDKMESNALNHLYSFFKEGRGQLMTMSSPVVESVEAYDPERLDTRFHQAGWDSFCTGVCFIKLAYLYAERQHGNPGKPSNPRPYTSAELLRAVQSMKNCVNVIRADISHVTFGGPDPKSERPQWLHVQSRRGKPCDMSRVAELFAKFGAVDVKPFSRHRALVAVGNHKAARDILLEFRKHHDFHVSKYNALKHSPYIRTFLWCCTLLSGGTCAWLLMRSVKQ